MAWPAGPRILICPRAGDPDSRPVPGSVFFACADCGHTVVVSPIAALEYGVKGTPIACVECFARHRDGGGNVVTRREW